MFSLKNQPKVIRSPFILPSYENISHLLRILVFCNLFVSLCEQIAFLKWGVLGGMNWAPSEVKHFIYVSIYRFHNLMHDLYRPAQVCTIYDHLSQRNISLLYRLGILFACEKKHFLELWEVKTLQKKSPPNSRTKPHFTKNESLHCGSVLRPIF